jgi:hypothetical protein
MKWKEVKKLGKEDFRRLTGLPLKVFERILEILKEEEGIKRRRGGYNHTLIMEDRLLMTIEYWREYRTYFHISKSYGISESACFRNIKWIEDTLVKHPDIKLPGKKSLLEKETEYEVILIDATETPVERPKKNKNGVIQEKRKDTRLRAKS